MMPCHRADPHVPVRSLPASLARADRWLAMRLLDAAARCGCPVRLPGAAAMMRSGGRANGHDCKGRRMHPLIDQHREAIHDLCRAYGVARLELFGSAATDACDPDRSDLDFIVAYPLGYGFGP